MRNSIFQNVLAYHLVVVNFQKKFHRLLPRVQFAFQHRGERGHEKFLHEDKKSMIIGTKESHTLVGIVRIAEVGAEAEKYKKFSAQKKVNKIKTITFQKKKYSQT